ncbi:MAG: aminoacyl-histidine dipeptidase [Firmicutes bacterium]|nr:aminoacyl-histidine dipeptidase [Bacillota bacterium]
MNTQRLAGLEPQSVFAHFEQLCAIPHGSGNTKQVSDFLAAFAAKNGIKCIQDSLNNILWFVPGTCGMESHRPVVLQGHMDMVCEKDAGCPLDMATQGLDLAHDGENIYARGTTLGGDDGIAVAFAMTLASDSSIPHPPLEILLTVDEEVGMEGASGVDLTPFTGRTMINLDSEDEGIFTVSCAGGARGTIHLNAQRRAVYGPCVRLTVEGLAGGHSGVDIDKRRANANKVMGELLGRVQSLMPVCITSFTGGAKDNAIPRSCTVTLVALGIDLERINGVTSALEDEIRAAYDEPDVYIHAEDIDALGGNALTTGDSARLTACLNSAPNGIQAWSKDIPGLVQTSLNLGVAKLGEEEFTMTFAVRSSVNAEKRSLLKKLEELAAFHGGSYSQMGDYPAWEYRADSPLRETMVALYTDMFGVSPVVSAIHAGLECGILSAKLPGLDCVSIGPQMQDIHTSREKLSIASTKRTWDFLCALLGRL